MKVEFKPDFPITDEACKEATGRPLSEWIAELESRPELKGKRRDAVNMFLYDQMGKNIWWATTAWVEYERKHNVVQRDGRSEGYNICVTKKIVAPIDKVFSAWTGDGIESWFGDSPKVAEDKSLSDSTGNKAAALRVRDNKDLRYRWTPAEGGQETQVDVTFTDGGNGKTELMLTHNRIQTRDETDGLRRAWGEAFSRLKAALES